MQWSLRPVMIIMCPCATPLGTSRRGTLQCVSLHKCETTPVVPDYDVCHGERARKSGEEKLYGISTKRKKKRC